MASRLIERLDAEIARADDPVRRDCLRAERACALARHGQHAEAKFALSGLRSQAQRRKSPLLRAWVAMLEGEIEIFESMSGRAMEKFRRAREQAILAGHRSMQALASAWMASLSFNASHLAGLAAQVAEALQLAQPQDYATWARISLTLADSFRFGGDEVRSQFWYLRARDYASADGDASMISAVLHNMSATRAANISLDDALGHRDTEAAAKALLEAESTANYDWGAGARALSAMVPVQLRAQLLVVLGRFSDAIVLYDAFLARARDEGMASREGRFLADRAWCHQQLGHVADALRDARQAERVMALQHDADDVAAAHGRLSAMFSAMGQSEGASRHRHLCQEALVAYRESQRQMLMALESALQHYPAHEGVPTIPEPTLRASSKD